MCYRFPRCFLKSLEWAQMTHFQPSTLLIICLPFKPKDPDPKRRKGKRDKLPGEGKIRKESSEFWKADLNKTVNPFVHNDSVVNFPGFEENNYIFDLSDGDWLNNYDYSETSNKSSVDCIYLPI